VLTEKAQKRIDECRAAYKERGFWPDFVIVCNFCASQLCKLEDVEELKLKSKIYDANGNLLPLRICKCAESIDYWVENGELGYSIEYL
jgi:hypothetical protein